VARVGRTDSDRVGLKEIENLLFDSYPCEGNISGGDSLREGIHVRDDAFVVLEAKHFTRATEPLHNFVRDHHNAILVA